MTTTVTVSLAYM